MAESDSLLQKSLPWIALAFGVGGVAYGVRQSGAASKSVPQDASGSGSQARSSKGAKKSSTKPIEKRAPGKYALFVKAQMPALMAQGYTTPQAMTEIGRRWKLQKT